MAGFDSVLDSLKKAEREVEAQLAGIRGAISSLAGGGRKRGPRGPIATAAPRKRRKLSAAARKAISNAQKKRWAKQKAAAKK